MIRRNGKHSYYFGETNLKLINMEDDEFLNLKILAELLRIELEENFHLLFFPIYYIYFSWEL